jgi:hypothetical protein
VKQLCLLRHCIVNKLLYNSDHRLQVKRQELLEVENSKPNTRKIQLEICTPETWRQYHQCQCKILHQSFPSQKVTKTILCLHLTPPSTLPSHHLQFGTRSLLSISQDQQLHPTCASLSHSNSSLKREFA